MTTRLISAGVGVVIALLVLYLHNTILLPIAVAVLSVIMMSEHLRANKLMRYRFSSIGSFLFAAGLPFVTVGTAARFRMLLTVICIGFILLDYVLYHKKMNAESFFTLIAGFVVIPGALSCALVLHNTHEQHGVAYLVLALGGAWIADSGAYFTGTFFGKTKLCPEISPKKTLEGFLGGIAADVVFFLVFNAIYSAVQQAKGTPISVSWVSTILLGIACALLGTLGDLVASVRKRQLDIKDYGVIMPGHGGLLDRFDSILLVVPFFCAYTQAASFFDIP